MNRSFPETLSALRRIKCVNQRTAAGDLGISQALLSHYENGVREPGLGFVCRACDYYGVSADYLLGRSDRPNARQCVEKAAEEMIANMQRLLDESKQTLESLCNEESGQ